MRDNKSKNKINKMLKVIKSANKSQITESSTDRSNVDSPQLLQPDEDDYGYVSQESSVLYKRLMEKYKSTPDEDRANASRPRPIGPAPTKRVPTSVSVGKSSSSSSTASKSTQPSPSSGRRPDMGVKVGGPSKNNINAKPQPTATASAVKPKPRRPPPPVVNFEALLKLAEQKQFEPIKVDQSDKGRKDDRPMSAKEKREHEERMRMSEARRKRLDNENHDYRKGAEPVANGSAPKGIQTNNSRRPESGGAAPGPSFGGGAKRNAIRPVAATATATSASPSSSSASYRPAPSPQQQQPQPQSNKSAVNGKISSQQNKTRAPPTNVPPTKTRQFPPPDVQRTRSFPPEDVTRRPASSARPFPPADVRRRAAPGPSYSSAKDYKSELTFAASPSAIDGFQIHRILNRLLDLMSF